jgi:hypothetical protein
MILFQISNFKELIRLHSIDGELTSSLIKKLDIRSIIQNNYLQKEV